jgi:hypothetical protein
LRKREKRPADAFEVNAETWNIIEQAVLAEYEKVIAKPTKN